MALTDCPGCWDTPCTCERGYLGSKIWAYNNLTGIDKEHELQLLKNKIAELEKEINKLKKPQGSNET